MKRVLSIIALLFSLQYLGACQNSGGNGQIKESIPVDQFEKKLAGTPGAQLVDVRSSGEFTEGHLAGAANMNINDDGYKDKFNTLDKNKPVFVYCLSGGRSGRAANIMQEMGFKEVYNMAGGIMKWESAGKPIEHGNAPPKPAGMSMDEFSKKVAGNNYVLVDYNAPWCAPCQKLMPMLEAFVQKRKDKVTLLKINYDDNKSLAKEKGISGIPYVELYHEGKLVWKHEGAIEEKQLQEETKL